MSYHNNLVSVTGLDALMAGGGDVVLLDCQFDLADPAAGRAAYLEAHLPGARYLHLDDDLSAPPTGGNGRHPLPDPAILGAKLRAAGLRTGQQAICYDAAGGPYAARAWWLLRWMGHEAAAVLDGGLPAWRAAGQPVEAGEPPAAVPGDFAPAPRGCRPTVTADEVLANIDGGDRLVIDVRAPERWRGEPNPLDPVAGHIPGSRNRFFKDNLAADGLFKPASQLAAELDAVTGGVPASKLILQCGSGVTACHVALALDVAGRGGASLYPGSWSEWIADPARPVSRLS